MLTILGGLFIPYVFYFFRDPSALFKGGRADSVLAAADGVVAEIRETFEPEVMKKPVMRVAIFLSVFNVHVNRAPIAGKDHLQQAHPGEVFSMRAIPRRRTSTNAGRGVSRGKSVDRHGAPDHRRDRPQDRRLVEGRRRCAEGAALRDDPVWLAHRVFIFRTRAPIYREGWATALKVAQQSSQVVILQKNHERRRQSENLPAAEFDDGAESLLRVRGAILKMLEGAAMQ